MRWPRFSRASHIYNSVDFALLNAPKADSVEFLTFRDKRLRGGLILGMCGAMARSPFSAPFGGLLLTREQTAGAVEDMYILAAQFAASRGMALRVTLPRPLSPGALRQVGQRAPAPQWRMRYGRNKLPCGFARG